MTKDEYRMTNVEVTTAADSSFVIRHSSLEEPPPLGLTGLPFGWLPIGIVSLLFGLAHLGYGPEPVPLFFLALMLGYIYYRTHRIVPCIVAHATFNSFSMAMLICVVCSMAASFPDSRFATAPIIPRRPGRRHGSSSPVTAGATVGCASA